MSVATQAQLTLDDFIEETFILTVPSSSFTSIATDTVAGDFNGAATDVFGDDRDVTIDVSASGGTATVAILPPGGLLSFDTGATVNAPPGASFEILYDDFLDVDVTSSSLFGAIAVEFIFVDESGDVTVTLDDGVNSGSVTGSVNDAGGSGPQSLILSLAAPGLAGVDLTSIDAITFGITTTSPAADFAIDTIQFVVPEPSTGLFLVAAGTLAALRRRQAA
ncbi:MAG: PEP-CTERM sorting domain-containing protein [Planctomycetota bacterium]